MLQVAGGNVLEKNNGVGDVSQTVVISEVIEFDADEKETVKDRLTAFPKSCTV